MKRIISLTFTVALLLATNAFAQGGKNLVINHFVSDPRSITSHLVITDVEGMGPTVSFNFFDNEGKKVGEGRELVPKFGKLNLDPAKYVNNKVVNGTIHITADNGNVIAEYWQFYKGRESWKNTTTLGQVEPGFSKLACPHFVADPGVESYIVVASTEGKEATINVKFCDDNGRELATKRLLVKANGKLAINPRDYIKTSTTGVAFVTSESGKITGEYWQSENSKNYQVANPMNGVK